MVRVRPRGRRSPQIPGYDAFISYSHLRDDGLAATLQAGLESFGTPWYRSRALRVFRDTTNLAATPQLLSDIIGALSVSKWFILIASEEAAHSPWVSQEVAWWLENRDPEKMLIALSSGSIAWTSGDFDWDATTALPRTLAGALRHEPRWVDFRDARDALAQSTDVAPRTRIRVRLSRFQARRQVGDWVADVAAPIRGISKDALVGAHLRYRKRTRRIVQTVVAVLLALTVATSVAAAVAVTQLGQAQRETQLATSRELAELADNLRGDHADLAELFAVEAYRLDHSPQALAALFQSVTASPHLVTYLQASGTVTAVAGSANGQVIVAGLSDGTVLRWPTPQARPVTIAHLTSSIASVSVDASGSAVVAVSRTGALWWSTTAGARSLIAPRGQVPTAVGISPSGRLAALGTAPPNPPSTAFDYGITLFGQQPDALKIATFNSSSEDRPQYIAFPSDAQMVILNSSGTTWHRLSVPSLTTLASSIEPAGANVFTWALAPNGAFFSISGGSTPLPLYPTTGNSTSLDSPPRSALTEGAAPTALAINSPGTLMAQADQGIIYVSKVARQPSSAPLQLTGNSAINKGAMSFDGPDRLLSASGNLVTVWNLAQYSRIATEASVTLPSACKACPNPQLTVRPDGRQVAIVSGRDDTMIIRGLSPGGRSEVISAGSTDTYGPVAWLSDGRRLLLPTATAGAEIWSTAHSLTRAGEWPTSPAAEKAMGYAGPDQMTTAPQLLSLRAQGRQAVEVDTAGDIMVRDTKTGRVEEAIKGPASMQNFSLEGQNYAAVDTAGQVVAVLNVDGGVTITSLSTRHSRVLPGPASGITFDGEQLLIQQANGTLQVWNARATHLIKVIAGTAGSVAGPVASRSGLIVETSEGGSGNVIDLNSGTTLGTIALPTGWRVNSTGLAMLPAGSFLVTATENTAYPSQSGTLTDWQMSPSAWVKVACRSAGHDLAPAVWQEYVGGPVPGDLSCADVR